MQVWAADRVLALAPDPAAAAAGRGLATGRDWVQRGAAGEPDLVWGLCQGSGTRPYQVAVDLAGPAYRCSCPSRKIPCKHVLGLLLLWSAGSVPASEPPEWAASWLAERELRATAAAARPARPVDPAAAAAAAEKRAEQRAGRVAAGLDELDRWLADRIRTGLAGLRWEYDEFHAVAARMVDAQAPAVAGALRRLPAVAAGGAAQWPGRLLEELALLHLTVEAHRRLDTLPAGLRASVRTRVGYPVGTDDVLATPAVADTWAVLGLRDHAEDRLVTRRIWLRGESTGRAALVLSFAPPGSPLPGTLLPGTLVEAELHFYPAAAPLRALVGSRQQPRPLWSVTGGGIEEGLAAYGAALAADPWVSSWPVVLGGVVPVLGDPWRLAEPGGPSVSIVDGSCDGWRLLAVSGGRPVTVAGEYTVDGFRPVSVVDGGLVSL